MSTLTNDTTKGEVERLKGVMAGLLGPDSKNVEGFLDKLMHPPVIPVKLNNLMDVVLVIDREYQSATSGSFPGSGSIPSAQPSSVVLGNNDACKELTGYLAGCVSRLKEARPDLVNRYSQLFS
jgi:hypothetical protein